MRRINTLLFGILVVLFSAPSARALNVPLVVQSAGKVYVVGNSAARRANINWEGLVVTRANPGGSFTFSTSDIPATCVGYVSDGVQVVRVLVDKATCFLPRGRRHPIRRIRMTAEPGRWVSLTMALFKLEHRCVIWTRG